LAREAGQQLIIAARGFIMPKKEIELGYATRLVNHSPVSLITVAAKGQVDIVAVGWLTPLSVQPPLIGIAISPRRYSHDLIRRAGEFVINIAQADMLKQVEYCGSISGEADDKFKAAGFTPGEPRRVSVPLINECFAAIECGLVEVLPLGDHSFFVGQALTVWADPVAFEVYWKPENEEGRTLNHFGGHSYGIIEKRLEPK